MGGKSGGSSGSDYAGMLANQQYQDAKPLQKLVYKDLINFMGGGSGGGETTWTETIPGEPVYAPTPGSDMESGKDTYRSRTTTPDRTIVHHQTSPSSTGYEGFLSRNPVYMGGKQQVENQYGRGMDNLLASMPAGGAMYENMVGMEQNRAQSIGDLAAGVYQDLYNKAYGVATGTPQQSVSQLAQIGAASDAAEAQRDAGQSAAAGGAASAIGSIIAAMIMA